MSEKNVVATTICCHQAVLWNLEIIDPIYSLLRISIDIWLDHIWLIADGVFK